VRQDENSHVSGKLSLVQRSVSKASHLYRNPSWDLVDALAEGEADVRTIDRKTLPGALRELDAAELEEHVEIMQNRRVALKDELSNLAEAREAFLQAERVRDAENSDEVLGDALIDSIRDQAEAAGFTLDPA
jgi:aminoglycoside phosphotransferase (APT) family kinase protein